MELKLFCALVAQRTISEKLNIKILIRLWITLVSFLVRKVTNKKKFLNDFKEENINKEYFESQKSESELGEDLNMNWSLYEKENFNFF